MAAKRPNRKGPAKTGKSAGRRTARAPAKPSASKVSKPTAKKRTAKSTKPRPPAEPLAPLLRPRPLRWLRRWLIRGVATLACLVVLAVAAGSTLNPSRTIYMLQEEARLGTLDQEWVPAEEIAPVMFRAVVAAEDANFCSHWGFDVTAIRAALEDGTGRGASTVTQQVVKNVYLWHGRSWLRKALEAAITPMVEAMWSKRRILEVYLNVAEFDTGVFGVEAAARHYFGLGPDALSPAQAAALAAVLPAPKDRSASRPTDWLQRRARAIEDGAATIAADGRAACFES